MNFWLYYLEDYNVVVHIIKMKPILARWDHTPIDVRVASLLSCDVFPMLLVADVARNGSWNIPFRQTFGMEETNRWVMLRQSLRCRFQAPRIVSHGTSPLWGPLPLGPNIRTYLESIPIVENSTAFKDQDFCLAAPSGPPPLGH